MSGLPDELWLKIMEAGIRGGALAYRDLCCLSIACRRLRRLSEDDGLWSALLVLDFPPDDRACSSASALSSSSSSQSTRLSSKAVYKTRFERQRARKQAAWRLAVLREESQVAEHARKIEDLRSLIDREQEKLKAASTELRDLERVRRASVAMNIWQPEVVRSSQRQLVEQSIVPVESRVSALEMELKLCKQQITVYSKAYSNHKRKLDERKEAVASLKYHPIDSHESHTRSNNRTKRQRKMFRLSLPFRSIARMVQKLEELGNAFQRVKTSGIVIHLAPKGRIKNSFISAAVPMVCTLYAKPDKVI
ncbi:hypothetical protein Taro_010218 [Colocasia esculenta]|uniref:F-box domain-containing protein n=1 Tax=Colocasia esculenta TaxID=4460 RepID=A0A843U2G9_COLES|nr:hypothetical protein [Colocasia esculenta]